MARAKRIRRRSAWTRLDDASLLDVRLCDLDLEIRGTTIDRRLRALSDELSDRGLRFRPHVWLSSEWFSPDGVPGVAIPFYLAHERLMRLEGKMMLRVEGAGERECMRILRHETGHAICTAYRLHYRPSWRRVFGHYSTPYPRAYRPDPASRAHVLHFDSWYAQAHPAEDFAETFAVWLRPNSDWKRQYRNWPAMRKLEYVDRLMHEIGVQPARVRDRRFVEPLPMLTGTLREHYRRKRRRYAEEWPEFVDQDLFKVFSADIAHAHRPAAAAFLRSVRREVREAASFWTGEHPYTIDQVLADMIDRCKELGLRLRVARRDAKSRITLLVTVATMNFLHGGNFRFAI
jgi:hypothetical protein